LRFICDLASKAPPRFTKEEMMQKRKEAREERMRKRKEARDVRIAAR